MPRWFFYFLLLDSPWKLINPVHVAYVQKIWSETLLNVLCTVALRDDPIFALVCLLFHWTPVLMLKR